MPTAIINYIIKKRQQREKNLYARNISEIVQYSLAGTNEISTSYKVMKYTYIPKYIRAVIRVSRLVFVILNLK